MNDEDLNNLPPLITSTQFARILGIKISTLYRHSYNGILPTPIRLSPKIVRYVKEDVLNFLRKKDYK